MELILNVFGRSNSYFYISGRTPRANVRVIYLDTIEARVIFNNGAFLIGVVAIGLQRPVVGVLYSFVFGIS